MATFPAKTCLSLLIFLCSLVLIHGIPTILSLDRSEAEAAPKIIQGLGKEFPPGTNPCNYPGVSCETSLSDQVLKITGLIYDSQNLNGSVSSFIGGLQELKRLSLSGNNIVGQIPAEIGNCSKLEVLNLGNNKFSGEIPANFSFLSRLRVLDLSSNDLSGDLSFLEYFPELENLSVAYNHFAGKIPESIRKLRNNSLFNFTGNQLSEGRAEQSTSGIPKPKYLIFNYLLTLALVAFFLIF